MDEYPICVVVHGPRFSRGDWGGWVREIKDYIANDLSLSNGDWTWSFPTSHNYNGPDEWPFYFRDNNATQAVQFKLRWT